MLASRSVISRLMQTTVRRYHAGEGIRPASMDELPVPRGSWQARHAANQRRYNTILLLGVGFLAGSIAIAKGSGLLYLNYAPPKSID